MKRKKYRRTVNQMRMQSLLAIAKATRWNSVLKHTYRICINLINLWSAGNLGNGNEPQKQILKQYNRLTSLVFSLNDAKFVENLCYGVTQMCQLIIDLDNNWSFFAEDLKKAQILIRDLLKAGEPDEQLEIQFREEKLAGTFKKIAALLEIILRRHDLLD